MGVKISDLREAFLRVMRAEDWKCTYTFMHFQPFFGVGICFWIGSREHGLDPRSKKMVRIPADQGHGCIDGILCKIKSRGLDPRCRCEFPADQGQGCIDGILSLLKNKSLSGTFYAKDPFED